MNEKMQEIIEKFTPEMEIELKDLHLVVVSSSVNETNEQKQRYDALVHLRDAAMFASKAIELDADNAIEEKVDDNYEAQAIRLNNAYIEKS